MNLAPCGAQRAFNLFPTDVLISSERDFVTSFLTGLLDDGVTRGRTMYFSHDFCLGHVMARVTSHVTSFTSCVARYKELHEPYITA